MFFIPWSIFATIFYLQQIFLSFVTTRVKFTIFATPFVRWILPYLFVKIVEEIREMIWKCKQRFVYLALEIWQNSAYKRSSKYSVLYAGGYKRKKTFPCNWVSRIWCLIKISSSTWLVWAFSQPVCWITSRHFEREV